MGSISYLCFRHVDGCSRSAHLRGMVCVGVIVGGVASLEGSFIDNKSEVDVWRLGCIRAAVSNELFPAH